MTSENNGGSCECSGYKRPQYFHGMLLDERDFKAEQAYHINKRHLLNRTLYGCGVVCGLDLKRASGTAVSIGSGLAFDCRGREIWVPEDYTVDVKGLIARDDFRDLCDDADPSPPEKYYLCLSYHDCGSDPVSSHVSDEACKPKGCENSRITEGFKVELLKTCPQNQVENGILACSRTGDAEDSGSPDAYPERWASNETLTHLQRCLKAWCCNPVPCPCEDPCKCECVIVGRVEVDDKGCVTEFCANDCRTYVMTGHMLQYLFTSILSVAGRTGPANSGFDAARMAGNPIEALCSLLPFLEQLTNNSYNQTMGDTLDRLVNQLNTFRDDTGIEKTVLGLRKLGLENANAAKRAGYVKQNPDADVIKAVWGREKVRPGGARNTVIYAILTATKDRHPEVHAEATAHLRKAK